LGQKIKDTLAFNQRVVAQNLQLQALPNFSNSIHSKRINHQAQAYKTNKQAYTKNNTPIKRKL
jgi:hypothetical protein